MNVCAGTITSSPHGRWRDLQDTAREFHFLPQPRTRRNSPGIIALEHTEFPAADEAPGRKDAADGGIYVPADLLVLIIADREIVISLEQGAESRADYGTGSIARLYADAGPRDHRRPSIAAQLPGQPLLAVGQASKSPASGTLDEVRALSVRNGSTKSTRGMSGSIIGLVAGITTEAPQAARFTYGRSPCRLVGAWLRRFSVVVDNHLLVADDHHFLEPLGGRARGAWRATTPLGYSSEQKDDVGQPMLCRYVNPLAVIDIAGFSSSGLR